MNYRLCMNQQKIDQLTERILNETLSAMSCLNLYLGHRLNMFQSIADSGPISSTELSNKTKYSERYLREWLECMTVLGYIEHDPATISSTSHENTQQYCVNVIIVHIQFLLFIVFQVLQQL